MAEHSAVTRRVRIQIPVGGLYFFFFKKFMEMIKMQNENKKMNGVAKMATQRDLDQGMKIRSSFIVDVKWLDACQHINVEKIDENQLEELLCRTHTIGKVVAQDNKVICVATNISEANGLDLIAIPIRWIEEIKIFG